VASARALEPAQADAARQTGGGSVAPTGSLLQDLLGQGGDPSVDRRREQNMDALRRRAQQRRSPALLEGRSPALSGAEAGLDYLLGSDGP
jgi:hypothetical protein